MDDAIRIRLDRPHDLLAYLPYRFGYVPTESLAVLAVLEPEPGTLAVGLAARLDLADLADPQLLVAARAGVVAQMATDPTALAVTVLYTDAGFADVRAGTVLGGRVLAAWLDGFPYGDPTLTLVASRTRFRCLECAEQPCCPDDGHPVERLAETAVAAGMVLAGEALAESREGLACPRDAEPGRARTAARAARRQLAAIDAHDVEQRSRWRTRTLDAFGRLLAQAVPGAGGSPPGAAVLGRLGAALADPLVRDVVVAWCLGGRRYGPGSPHVLEVFEGVVAGALRLPDREHLDAATAVLAQIARHAPPGGAGYALAVLGWLAWWRGEGARADVLQRQCVEEDPCCRLGLLLGQLLDGGVRPGWARPPAVVAPHPR